MRHTLLALVTAVLLTGSVSAAAPQAVPLSARLAWEEAFGLGDLEFTGGLVALHFAADPDRELPPTAAFVLNAAHVDLLVEYRDFAGNPDAAMVGTDTTMTTDRDSFEEPRLGLSALRPQVQVLVAPKGEATLPLVRLASRDAVLAGQEGVQQPFFVSPNLLPSHEFQRTAARDVPAVSFETSAASESIVVAGDFVVYLWDLDVASQDGRVFQSGELYSNEQGQTDRTPNGVAAQKRRQLLTLDVTDGRMALALPGRPLSAFAEATAAQVLTRGSWDLDGATGSVELAGEASEVASADLHLEGDFTTTFAPAGQIESLWDGDAVDATAGQVALPAGTVSATVVRAPPWLPIGLGIGLLALGGASYGVLRVRAPTRVAPPVPGPMDETEPDEAVLEAIANMEAGEASKVIQALQPSFDPAAASAPVRAYLLSLAHLQEGRREEGVTWILRAIESFPEFAHELAQNPSFAPIRDDPRLRRFRQGVAGYV